MAKRRTTKAIPTDVERMETELAARNAEWYESVCHLHYDGVVGTLPTWVPEPIRKEFEQVRFAVFERWRWRPWITVEEVRKWVHAYETGAWGVEFVRDDNVARLARWHRIVGLGQKRGAEELGIPDAAVVAHAHKFTGRKPRAISLETKFIAAMLVARPHEDTEGLWRWLRKLQDLPDDQRIVGNVSCPFGSRYDRGKPILLKAGKPYLRKTFANAVARLRNPPKSTRKQ